jgi:hypothetical protein
MKVFVLGYQRAVIRVFFGVNGGILGAAALSGAGYPLRGGSASYQLLFRRLIGVFLVGRLLVLLVSSDTGFFFNDIFEVAPVASGAVRLPAILGPRPERYDSPPSVGSVHSSTSHGVRKPVPIMRRIPSCIFKEIRIVMRWRRILSRILAGLLCQNGSHSERRVLEFLVLSSEILAGSLVPGLVDSHHVLDLHYGLHRRLGGFLLLQIQNILALVHARGLAHLFSKGALLDDLSLAEVRSCALEIIDLERVRNADIAALDHFLGSLELLLAALL